MRKVLFALVMVSLFGFGLRIEGEAAQKDFLDCIHAALFHPKASGKAAVGFLVGPETVWLTAEGMRVGHPAPELTYAQVAAFEPLLASLRAGGAARVKAKVFYDDSTKRVNAIRVFFGNPCS